MMLEVDEKIINGIMNKAYKFDAQKWCDWIQNDFQLLRNKNVKRMYCDKCSK